MTGHRGAERDRLHQLGGLNRQQFSSVTSIHAKPRQCRRWIARRGAVQSDAQIVVVELQTGTDERGESRPVMVLDIRSS